MIDTDRSRKFVLAGSRYPIDTGCFAGIARSRSVDLAGSLDRIGIDCFAGIARSRNAVLVGSQSLRDSSWTLQHNVLVGMWFDLYNVSTARC